MLDASKRLKDVEGYCFTAAASNAGAVHGGCGGSRPGPSADQGGSGNGAPGANGGLGGHQPPGLDDHGHGCPAGGRVGSCHGDAWTCHCKHVDYLIDDVAKMKLEIAAHATAIGTVSTDMVAHNYEFQAAELKIKRFGEDVQKLKDTVNAYAQAMRGQTPGNPSAQADSWATSGRDPWNQRGPTGGGDRDGDGGGQDGNGGRDSPHGAAAPSRSPGARGSGDAQR